MGPRKIAERLTAEGDDLGAAAVLVALVHDHGYPVGRDDLGYVRDLQKVGCLDLGKKPTPLGERVAVLLERMGIEPLEG